MNPVLTTMLDCAVWIARAGDGERGEELEQARDAVAEMIEAMRTFVAWLDREEAGSGVGHLRDSSPEAEAQWRAWYEENLRLCALARTQGRAALDRVQGGAA